MNKKQWPPSLIPKDEFHHTEDWYLFNKWYAENIESLDEGVQVTGIPGYDWSANPNSQDTHKALLIGIQPIKEPNAEQLLEEIVQFTSAIDSTPLGKAIGNARKFLERRRK